MDFYEVINKRHTVRECKENNAVSAVGTVPQKMYAYAMPRQYTMPFNASYVIIHLFRVGTGLFHATAVNGLNNFASVWCVVENIFLED